MKRTFLWSIALCLTAGMLSTALTSCSDDDDNGGSANNNSPVGIWKKAGENSDMILILSKAGTGRYLVIPKAGGEVSAMKPRFSAPAKEKVLSKTFIKAIDFTFPDENGKPGYIHFENAPEDVRSTFEIQGKLLLVTEAGGEDEEEKNHIIFTRAMGAEYEDYIPTGHWYWKNNSDEVAFTVQPSTGDGIFSVNYNMVTVFVPTSANKGTLYYDGSASPEPYTVKGDVMTMQWSSDEIRCNRIDTKQVVGQWKFIQAGHTYICDFQPTGKGTETQQDNGAMWPFIYFATSETTGYIFFGPDNEYEYEIDGDKMITKNEEASWELTKL